MNKKIILFLVIGLILSACLLTFSFIKKNSKYSYVIQENWKINLPEEYEEIYSIDSGDSFLGDGERYHVFEYKDSYDINQCLDWKSKKDLDVESNVYKILKELDASKSNYPNFQSEYKYYSVSKNDFSKIYIVFVPSLKRLYVTEYFQ